MGPASENRAALDRADGRTREIYGRLVAEGVIMPSAGVWHGRSVVRFSASSWRTGKTEVRDAVAAVERAAAVPVRRTISVGE